MDSAFLFWDKYLTNQVETTWDAFSNSFTSFLTQYGSITLDDEQILYIKSIIDPDYRNIVKISDYLIFHEIYWKTQSKRQALFKHQFKLENFKIPKQTLKALILKVVAISNGYPDQINDIIVTRTHSEGKQLNQEEVFTVGSSENCDFQIKQDLQVNSIHTKFVWTPYNLFLIQDLAKSFRTSIRIDKYILDSQMVVRLNQDTMFKVKFIYPLPKSFNHIQTYQDDLQNQLPELLKQLPQFKSVLEFRNRQINHKEYLEQVKLIIEFIEGPLKGQEYVLDSKNEYVLGCGKNCSIYIPDMTLQKEHCVIKYQTQWVIEHKNSQYLDPTTFGTFILLANSTQNDLLLPSRPHVLHDSAKIIIGPFLLQVLYQ
ncbi:hypothetical protein pb186bvf_015413 [Paramecium bursaria]